MGGLGVLVPARLSDSTPCDAHIGEIVAAADLESSTPGGPELARALDESEPPR